MGKQRRLYNNSIKVREFLWLMRRLRIYPQSLSYFEHAELMDATYTLFEQWFHGKKEDKRHAYEQLQKRQSLWIVEPPE